jgi:hypothetical protein
VGDFRIAGLVGRAVELVETGFNRVGNGGKQLSLTWSEDMSKAADSLASLAAGEHNPDLEALSPEVRDHVTHDLVSGELEEEAPRGVDKHDGRLRIPGSQGRIQVPAEVLDIAKKISLRGRTSSIPAGIEICAAPGAGAASTISRGRLLNWNSKVRTLINTAPTMP